MSERECMCLKFNNNNTRNKNSSRIDSSFHQDTIQTTTGTTTKIHECFTPVKQRIALNEQNERLEKKKTKLYRYIECIK